MREIRASTPAKINLTLRVGPPSPDAYHPLVTVFEVLDLREYLTVRTTRTPGIRVATDAYLPDDSYGEATTARMRELPADSHLAHRVAKRLQRLAMGGPWGQSIAGIDIYVDKHIPMAGGMTGGSADVAAALITCNELWELGLSGQQLKLLARSLGADVPACLAGGIVLGTRRGDHMDPLDEGAQPRHYWTIALTHEGLETPGVFRILDEAQGLSGIWKELTQPSSEEIGTLTGDSLGLAPLLVNDLQETALRMHLELADTMRATQNAGALAVILSGSGPSIATLAQGADGAHRLAQALEGAPSVAHAFTTHEPVPGVRLEQGVRFHGGVHPERGAARNLGFRLEPRT